MAEKNEGKEKDNKNEKKKDNGKQKKAPDSKQKGKQKNAPKSESKQKRRGCCSCSGCLIRSLIAFVLMIAIVVGATVVAYDQFAKPITGLKFGDAFGIVTSAARAKEKNIVTNPYDAEADLNSFYSTFKAGAFIKEECNIDLEDILNSITQSQDLEGEAQNVLSDIEFDTDAIRRYLAESSEDNYVPKTISVSDKEVAALINNLVYTALSLVEKSQSDNAGNTAETLTTVYDVAIAESEAESADGGNEVGNALTDLASKIPFKIDPNSIKVAQVVINGNQLDKESTELKLTLNINVRSIFNSFAKGAMDGSIDSPLSELSGPALAGVKAGLKVAGLFLPKKLFVSMTVRPFAKDQAASIGVNSFDDEQMAKLNIVLDNLREQGYADIDLRETLIDINNSVVDVFEEIDELVNLTFVDSSLSIKPIEIILNAAGLEDVSEAEIVSLLKAIWIVDSSTIVTQKYEEGSSAELIARLKEKYAIDAEYDLKLEDLLNAESDGSSLTNLVDHITLAGFDLSQTNDQMKVAITGNELADIVAKTLASNMSSGGETIKNMNIKVEQISFVPVGTSGNKFALKMVASADIKAAIKKAVDIDGSGGEVALSLIPVDESATAGDNEKTLEDIVKKKFADLIDGLFADAMYLTCEIVFDTDESGKVINLNIDYDSVDEIPTTLALNNLSAAETKAKLDILSKLLSNFGSDGNDLDMKGFERTIDSSVRGAIASLAQNETLSIDLVFRTEADQTNIYLPSLYELLYLVSGMDPDAKLSDGTPVTPDTIRLALKELVEFDSVRLNTVGYTDASGTTLMTTLKDKYFIDDSAKLDYTGTIADGKTIVDYKLTSDNVMNSEMAADIVNRIDWQGMDLDRTVSDSRVPVYGDQLAKLIASTLVDKLPEGISAELKNVVIKRHASTVEGTPYTIEMILKLDIAKLGDKSGESEQTNIIANLLYNDMFLTTSSTFLVNGAGKIVDLEYDENNVRTEIIINEATVTSSNSLSTADLVGVAQNLMKGFGGEEALSGLDLNAISAQVDSALRQVFTTLADKDALGAEPTFGFQERTAGKYEACLVLPAIYEIVYTKGGFTSTDLLSDGNVITPDTIRLAVKEMIGFDDTALSAKNYSTTDGETFIETLKAQYAVTDDPDHGFVLSANTLISGETTTLSAIPDHISLNGYNFTKTVAERKVNITGAALAALTADKIAQAVKDSNSDADAELYKVLIDYVGYDSDKACDKYSVTIVVKVTIDSSSASIINDMMYKGLYITAVTTFDVKDGSVTDLGYVYADAENKKTSVIINNAVETTADTLSTSDMISVIKKAIVGVTGSSQDAIDNLSPDTVAETIDDALRDALDNIADDDALGNVTFANVSGVDVLQLPSIYEVVRSKSGADVTAEEVRLIMRKMYTPEAVTTLSAENTPDLDSFIATLNANYYLRETKALTKDDLFGDESGADNLYAKLANTTPGEEAVDFAALYADTNSNSSRRTALNDAALAEILAIKLAGKFDNDYIQNPEVVDAGLYAYKHSDPTDLAATSGVGADHIGLYVYMVADLVASGSNANLIPDKAYVKLYVKFRDADGYYDGSDEDHTWATIITINGMTAEEQDKMFAIMNGLSGKSGEQAISTAGIISSVDGMMSNVLDNISSDKLPLDYVYDSSEKVCSIVFPSLFDYTATILFDTDYADYRAGTPDVGNVFVSYPYRTDDPFETEIGEVVKGMMIKLHNYEYVNDYSAQYESYSDYISNYYYYGSDPVQTANYYGKLFNMDLVRRQASIHDVAVRYFANEDENCSVALGSGAGLSGISIEDFRLLPASLYGTEKTEAMAAMWDGLYISGFDYAYLVGKVSTSVKSAEGDNSALLQRLIPDDLYIYILKDWNSSTLYIAIDDMNADEQALLFSVLQKYRVVTTDDFSEASFVATLGGYIEDVMAAVEDRVSSYINILGMDVYDHCRAISEWTADDNDPAELDNYDSDLYGYVYYEVH